MNEKATQIAGVLFDDGSFRGAKLSNGRLIFLEEDKEQAKKDDELLNEMRKNR